MFCLGIFVCSQSGGHHPSQDVEKEMIIPSNIFPWPIATFTAPRNSFKIH
jgi:hypothetical protein